jgi:hypothetical protein
MPPCRYYYILRPIACKLFRVILLYLYSLVGLIVSCKSYYSKPLARQYKYNVSLLLTKTLLYYLST